MANLPSTMHAVQLTEHGDFDVLKYATNLPLPALAQTDVLIKVMAAGVNNTDLNTRTAWYAKKQSSKDDASWSGCVCFSSYSRGRCMRRNCGCW